MIALIVASSISFVVETDPNFREYPNGCGPAEGPSAWQVVPKRLGRSTFYALLLLS
jgi:hypothetical protein